jgi:transcriptional regulator with XRE-family HTH domain
MGIADMADIAILEELGNRIRSERLNRDLTQAELSRTAGISCGAMHLLEAGHGCTMSTLIRILRALDRLDALDAFLPAPGPSPLQLARLKGKERQRASGAGRKRRKRKA